MLLAVSDGAWKQASHRRGGAIVVTTQTVQCAMQKQVCDAAKEQHFATGQSEMTSCCSLQWGFASYDLGPMLALLCPVNTTLPENQAADIRLHSMPDTTQLQAAAIGR